MCSCIRPHLGLATTRELLDELAARFELHVDGGLEYRTVGGEERWRAEEIARRRAVEKM